MRKHRIRLEETATVADTFGLKHLWIEKMTWDRGWGKYNHHEVVDHFVDFCFSCGSLLDLVFSEDFLKAFFGEEDLQMRRVGHVIVDTEMKTSPWQYHAHRMLDIHLAGGSVVKYLGEFMEGEDE